MFCIKCGAQLPDDVFVCDACGTELNEEIKNIPFAENVTQNVEVEYVGNNDSVLSFNNMNYEADLLAQKQLKKARRLADSALGTGIAAVSFLILGVVLIPFFWFLWFVAFMLGIATFLLAFLSKRAMYELMFNDLYNLQIKKVKITYRKGKIAAAIAMISAVVGVVAIIFTIYYLATAFFQSDFTEAVQLLWGLVTDAIGNVF